MKGGGKLKSAKVTGAECVVARLARHEGVSACIETNVAALARNGDGVWHGGLGSGTGSDGASDERMKDGGVHRFAKVARAESRLLCGM